MTQGTPKTLRGAIENGRATGMLKVELIEQHVIDFIAQKFGPAMLEANDAGAEMLAQLYERITGRKVQS